MEREAPLASLLVTRGGAGTRGNEVDGRSIDFAFLRRAVSGALVLALGLATAVGVLGEEAPDTPAEQYRTLLKEYQIAASSGRVLSDEERMEFVGKVYELRDQLAFRFVELAERYPSDPIAVDALMQAIWQVNTTPWPVELVGRDERWVRAFALLERDHIQSDKLGPACQRLSWGFRREYERFLRAVLEKNPHRHVQAQACLGLAHFLAGRLRRLDLAREQPELAREFADLFGREYLEELERRDRAGAISEAEAFFERAAEKYGDVKLPDGRTVGETASVELFEIRHLSSGREAPDIEGVDQDGMRLRLSDYRGKVVLLDFWQEY